MNTATVYLTPMGQFGLAQCDGCRKVLVKDSGGGWYVCPGCLEDWSTIALEFASHGAKVNSHQKITATVTPPTTPQHFVPSLSGPGEAFWDGVRRDWVCNCWAGSACNISACPVLGPGCMGARTGGYVRECSSCKSLYGVSALTNSTLAAPTPATNPAPITCRATAGYTGVAEYEQNATVSAPYWFCQTCSSVGTRYRLKPSSVYTKYSTCPQCYTFYCNADLARALVPVTPPTAPTLIPTAGLSLMASASGTLNSLNSQYQALYGDSDLDVPEPEAKPATLCAGCDRELCPELDTYIYKEAAEYWSTYCYPCRRNRGVK